MTIFLVGLVVFLAVFTQSLSGFGSALVAMALLPALIGIRVATPLVALAAAILEIGVILRYREALNVHAIWRIVLAGLIGTPLGVLFLTRLDESIALGILGAVIAGYAIYALLEFKLPQLEKPFWAYLAGAFCSCCGFCSLTPALVRGSSSGKITIPALRSIQYRLTDRVS